MSNMFYNVWALTNIDALSGWDTFKVTDMNRMFYGDSHITSLQPIFNWNVQNSTTKTDMFYGIPTSVERPGWY